MAKLPITIKNSRSAERVYNLQKIHQLRSVTEALVSNTPSNRQLMSSRRIETAVLPDLQGYERCPPKNEELLLSEIYKHPPCVPYKRGRCLKIQVRAKPSKRLLHVDRSCVGLSPYCYHYELSEPRSVLSAEAEG